MRGVIMRSELEELNIANVGTMDAFAEKLKAELAHVEPYTHKPLKKINWKVTIRK